MSQTKELLYGSSYNFIFVHLEPTGATGSTGLQGKQGPVGETGI